MSDVAKWLSETTFCDCEEWCVHAEVQRLAAQQHEALVELAVGLTPDVSQRCATKALRAGEDFKRKHE